MFTEAEWRPVLESLVRLTMSGKIDWELVDPSANTFEATIDETTYSLGSVDSDGRQPFSLTVLEGEMVLDELATNGRSGAPLPTGSFFDIQSALQNHMNPLNALLIRLHGLARRSAFGAEEKAASLLKALVALEDPTRADADRLQAAAEANAD